MTETNLPFFYYILFSFIFGLIMGSFINVVIHRVPLGKSVIFPGSHCPACEHPLKPIDNIPVLSYLILRGRCRYCRERIPATYPLVELLTGLFFAVIMLKNGPGWEALPEMAFAATMIGLIWIDGRHHLLPNVITYPALVLSLAVATLRGGWGRIYPGAFDISIIFPAFDAGFSPTRAAILGAAIFILAAPGFWLLDRLDLILFNKYFEWEELNEDESAEQAEIERVQNRFIYLTMALSLLLAIIWATAVLIYSPAHTDHFRNAYAGLWRAEAGAIVGGSVIWWLRAVYFYIRGFEGMGLGDVKLIAVIGAFLGWQGALGVLFFASVLGSAIGIILAIRSRKGLRTPMPFGVCLGIGALISMLTVPPYFLWYVNQ